MKLNKFSIMMALLSASLVLAQGPGPGGPPGPGPGRGPGGPRGGGFGMHQRKLVTGAPYSADVSNTTTRTLADSNTIQHTTTGQVARDSQGRTYSMETVTGGMLGANGPKTFIFITDPVAGYSYSLNPTTKTAMRRALHTPHAGGTEGGSAAPATTPKTRPANPNVVETDLGTQVVNGVSATGKKMTRTIPAGTMGNTLPIVSTGESWYSTDLKVMVSATRNDPQQGQESYALTNIQRAEPAASLFQVPSDYTVKDEARGGGRFGAAQH